MTAAPGAKTPSTQTAGSNFASTPSIVALEGIHAVLAAVLAPNRPSIGDPPTVFCSCRCSVGSFRAQKSLLDAADPIQVTASLCKIA